jgi:GxxExxY protein
MEHEALTHRIIGCAMTVHRSLGPGYLESVYQNALDHELRLSGLIVERQRAIEVRYRDVIVGTFVADFLVDGGVIVETKAIRALAPAHEAQVVNYLTSTGVDIGLLINFGAQRLEFRRKTRTYVPRSS